MTALLDSILAEGLNRGSRHHVHLSKDDLDNALAGLLTLSDPSGIDGGEDGAHGNGFDRVGAFQDGYEGGAETCAAYESNPPAVTESGYTSYEDQANDGNLSLNDMLSTITKSLDEYWTSQSSKLTAPTITAGDVSTGDGSDGGVISDSVTYQSSDNTVHYDAATLQDAAIDRQRRNAEISPYPPRFLRPQRSRRRARRSPG